MRFPHRDRHRIAPRFEQFDFAEPFLIGKGVLLFEREFRFDFAQSIPGAREPVVELVGVVFDDEFALFHDFPILRETGGDRTVEPGVSRSDLRGFQGEFGGRAFRHANEHSAGQQQQERPPDPALLHMSLHLPQTALAEPLIVERLRSRSRKQFEGVRDVGGNFLLIFQEPEEHDIRMVEIRRRTQLETAVNRVVCRQLFRQSVRRSDNQRLGAGLQQFGKTALNLRQPGMGIGFHLPVLGDHKRFPARELQQRCGAEVQQTAAVVDRQRRGIAEIAGVEQVVTVFQHQRKRLQP